MAKGIAKKEFKTKTPKAASKTFSVKVPKAASKTFKC